MTTEHTKLILKNPIAHGIALQAKDNGTPFSKPMIGLLQEQFFYPPEANLTVASPAPSYVTMTVIPAVKVELEKKYQDVVMRNFPQVSEALSEAIYVLHKIDHSVQAIDALSHQMKADNIQLGERVACDNIIKALPAFNQRRQALAAQVSEGLINLADAYVGFGEEYAKTFKGDATSQQLLQDLISYIKYAAKTVEKPFPLLSEEKILAKDSARG